MRIAINGMGRIGRLLFRRLALHHGIELVAVNDIMDLENLAYLVKYDSVYGTFDHEISTGTHSINVDHKKINVLQVEDPTKLPWRALGIDIVLECTGKFKNLQAAGLHLNSGTKKVLLSTTGATDIDLMIYGFNQDQLTPSTKIISPGGCMTNCSIPVLDILNPLKIESVQVNILHSYTSRQELVDTANNNFRRGRAAAESIIPVEIDLHQSIERLMPILEKRIAAVSTRVPVANGAMADFSIQFRDNVSVAEMNELFKNASQQNYKGIVGYTGEQLVSTDIKGNTNSCIIDGSLTSVAGRQVKLIAWFDNEYGFTSRMIDWILFWKHSLAR